MPKSLFEARRESALLNQELLQELQTSEHVEEEPSRATAAGDRRKLRGIPAIGRGVDGAIPGSNPEDILEAMG